MKSCANCKELKVLSEFYNDKRHKRDGKMSRCKKCHTLLTLRWREKNRDRVRALDREFRQRNPGKVRADRAKRHAAQMQAVPSWMTRDHLQQIRQFYANCPKGMEVDHIVPLRGKQVRGLHVIWNLRYLNRSDNRRKSNKFE